MLKEEVDGAVIEEKKIIKKNLKSQPLEKHEETRHTLTGMIRK